LQSIGDGVIATDSFGLITRINEAARKLTGWPGDEALGQPLRSVFGIGQAGARRADTDPVVDVLHRGQAVGQSTGAVLVSRDGTERRVAHTAAPIRSVTGQVVGVVLVFSDVTENHCMVQALRDREVQLHTMADALPGPLARLDRDGRYVFANAAYERWFGLKPADMLGRRREEVLVPEALEHVKPLIERALAGVSANTDATVQTLAGQRHAVVTALPDRDADGHVAGVILTTVDFTDRKLAEQELRASEASRRMAGRLARLGGWRYEVATRQLWLPPEIEGLLPESRKGPLDADVALQRVLPAHREALRARIRACVAQGETFDFEMALRAGDGREIQVRMIGEAERGEGGRVVLLQGAIQDVTESRREQQQLRLLQASVARLNDVVVITEAEPMNEGGPPIVFVNDAFERVTGWPREAVLGRSVRLLQGPLTDAAEVARIDLAQREREPVRAELQYCTRDGRPYWAQVEIVPLLDAAGMATHLVTVQRDITERKEGERERLELERHLREAQKMESIGTLAGGIAHDFNNILAAILGNVALAQGDLPAGHAASLSLEQIRRAGLRARSLVQQILAFSRHQPQVLHVQPLRPAVEETISLLRATLPAGVRLHSCLADEPLRVQADATQLQQLLMNLCTNAWHALPDGHGRIEVGLRAVSRAAAAHASLGAGPPGPCAHLWVRDDGIGMDAATRQRIFDPFFTTKPVGKGTGLGLSVVHGIVRGHGGAMAVESAPGQGSTFHLVLPLAQAEGLAAVLGAGAKPAFGAGPVAGVNVLYVDDDEVMTLMVQRLLQRAGYRVTVCNEAAEALALVRADPTRFDVAVSDYNMPEMTGTELAGALARVQPGLPVIISSGFITDALREQALESHVAAVLQKEHTLDELPALVGSVLIGQP
jgi:PAS domain S-box-containing protein